MNKSILKRDLYLSMILTRTGLALLMIDLIVLCVFSLYHNTFALIGFFIGIATTATGSIIASKKCYCPYCHAGRRWSLSDRKYLSILSLHKDRIVCPMCSNIIHISDKNNFRYKTY